MRLEAEVLRYDPGRRPFNRCEQRGLWGRDRLRVAVVARSDIREFVLDRVGERQRLHFDWKADRLEIGAWLREPEREWLFAALQRWHKPR